jgi:integrase
MPIVNRGSSFQATVAHKGERFRRQFSTMPEAQAWEHDTKARMLRGEQPDMGDRAMRADGKPHTLGELRDWLMETHWRKQKAAKTAGINADEVVAILGASKPITKIDGHAVGQLKASLDRKGNANATINRKLASLSRMLTEAIRLEIIDRKPYIERLKESERRRFRFTPEHEEKAKAFFSRIGHPEVAHFILVSVDTGLRQGELLGLRWSDVGAASLTVSDTKNGKNRVVPLTARAARILTQPKDGDNPEADDVEVFAGLNVWSLTHYWGRLRENLELTDEPSFVPHILRHEFCSRLADKGVNASAIMRLAGHSSLSVTQRYVNMSPVSLGDAIRALELT